ncbi:LysR family transcriptional regulator [Vibrio sp. AK197]
MDRLTAAKVFIEIAEQGSLTKAAEHLNMSTAMVSRYLAAIEQWFGARLLHRTTRKVSLTDAGVATLPACKKMLLAVEDAKNIAMERSQEPVGVLRVASSGSFADAQLTQALVEFQHRYPKIEIILSVGHNHANLVKDRLDLAIKITNTLDPTLIARPLAMCHSVLCASPDYVAKHGKPSSLDDLQNHYCITHVAGNHRHYRFIQNQSLVEVPVKGYFQSNETDAVCRAVLCGAGIGMLPTFYIGEQIKQGKLIPLLTHEQPEILGIHAVYLSREHQPLNLRLLVDFLVERFGGTVSPWDRKLNADLRIAS